MRVRGVTWVTMQPTRPKEGRPSKLDDPVTVDGETLPVGDAIVARLRLGAYREQAAASFGVVRKTLYNWMRTGARARKRAEEGEHLSDPHDIACMEFLHALEVAEAEAEFADWHTLGKLAAGGLEQTVTTIKVRVGDDDKETEIDRTTRTTRTLPDVSALQWRLSRRYPHHYTDRSEVVLRSDPSAEVESQDERAASLADAAEAYVQGHTDGAASAVVDPPAE